MNITTFPKLKRRHIILWRIAIWFVVTFWVLPKRVLFFLLDFPLAVVYNICIFVEDTIYAFCKDSYEIGITFVRYFRGCKYLIHATAEDGDGDGK